MYSTLRCKSIIFIIFIIFWFVTGCEQLGKLECVVHLPLSPLEEDALVSYLRTSSYPAAQDYLLVYYLQRARLVFVVGDGFFFFGQIIVKIFIF